MTMGVNDGTVIGSELLLDHGSPIDRWNLTLVSEGYTEQELPNFRLHSLEFVTLLLATPPFAGPSAAINVYRLDVASSQSGADDPAPCGTGATADTFFDARFCANGLDRRVLVVDTTLALNTVYAELPWSHAILVIVNSPLSGGTGGGVATTTLHPKGMATGLHELGHSAFGLADEYDYASTCNESGRDFHPAVEPAAANVTVNSSFSTLKWGHLVDPSTPMPTSTRDDCSVCEGPGLSPTTPGTVGAYTGGNHYHCGVFRGEYDCKMRAHGEPFCAVCQERINAALFPFFP
ncbi:M64 family metallopeptidase [Streptomyces tanashiensis]|uniref:M64 family metallopeptidase n=1 Tax=Streptomyces tanashiensis TaxID=67367 RepID=A0ABY6QRH9_9ACTN|nr:M64 family metallopeptidase [Streptomyces tanashiensis]UZX19786.1 M64 family metallopeptidase [Streptomyces tanashiensis]